jgi:acetyl esterase/lipase
MNLKVMSVLVPGLRYSAHPAPVPVATPLLTIDVAAQIPRRSSGVVTRRGIGYRDGLRLDLVTPTVPGPHPLVVYLPGGGFVRAPRGLARRERAFVAAAGYAVASVEYRTVRQHATVADGLADVRAAVDHLTGQAGTHGIDAGRIGLWGESAGGYLASVAGLTDPRIRAVVDEFGASDLSVMAAGFDERMRTALADPRHPVHRYRAAETNPVDLVRAEAPAFLFLHGADDRIIPPAQTLALHRALREAGADSTYHLLAGAGHGMLSLSRRQARQWTSVQVLTLITEFLDRTLRS